jgi:hypothetical protein
MGGSYGTERIIRIDIDMRQCVYCGDRSRLWSRICPDCQKLMGRVDELRGKVGFGEFLDGLEQTGVAKQTDTEASKIRSLPR